MEMAFVYCTSLSHANSVALPVMRILRDINMHIVNTLKHMRVGMQTAHFNLMYYAKTAKKERNGHSDEIVSVKPGFPGPGYSQRLSVRAYFPSAASR